MLWIVRPEPQAAATAARAAALGFPARAAPLSDIVPLPFAPPPAPPDAILLTSANAAPALAALPAAWLALPVFAVGVATAAAARAAGAGAVAAGEGDGQAALDRAAGHRVILHLAAQEHAPLRPPPGAALTVRVVYANRLRAALPAGLAADAASGRAVLAFFSARTAAHAARLLGPSLAASAFAALSPQVAAAAGPGWRSAAVAARPSVESLLAAAAPLCEHGR